MVYGAITTKGEKSYTYLRKVFKAIGNKQTNYNWLITDCICYPQNKDIEEMLDCEYCWISGEELSSIVAKEDFQWIWAVLSGFEKDIPLSEVLKYPLPYADGYSGFWKNPLSIQNPLASVEIVLWDSSLTLVISKHKEIVDDYMAAFQYSKDLVQYNAK